MAIKADTMKKGEHIKGLKLSKMFFEEYGRDVLKSAAPELWERTAAGLCGRGSECQGYDDTLSEDHDFDPGFCVWLDSKDYESSGFKLYRAYESLPKEYMGYERKKSDFFGRGRRGVFSIQDFYRELIGMPEAPSNDRQWFLIPEYALREAVSGEVFTDPLGKFSEVRQKLQRGYPEDVRLKKIAARAALMAQSGQYNFNRCLGHGEREGAMLARNEFVRESIAMLYLLNRAYMPFYKWCFRGLRELDIKPELLRALKVLSYGGSGIEDTEDTIEYICSVVAAELVEKGMSDSKSDYLEAHARSVTEHIKSDEIRAMHLMEGVI